MLRSNIKASSITNLTDARYFAAWDVEWVAFSLDPESENYISPQRVAAIKEWIEGPKIVGEFGQQSAGQIQELINYLELSVVQVGVEADEDLLQQLDGVTVIKEVVLENIDTIIADIEEQLDLFENSVSMFLLNFGEHNIEFSDLDANIKEALQEICQRYNIILSIDLNKEDLDDILESIDPLGLQVAGGEEEKVGFKSFDELDDIFEALETFE